MAFHSDNVPLDEEGYAQLDFRSRDTLKTHLNSKKGSCAGCRTIAVILGIVCLILLVVTAVLGAMAIGKPYSGNNNTLDNEKFPPRNNGNNQNPTVLTPIHNATLPKALTTTGTLSISRSCPPGWLKHRKSCYLFTDTQESWYVSKRKCSQWNSSLLKIDNADELEFIDERVDLQKTKSFWIGLSRKDKEAPWQWEDGSGISPELIDVKSTPAPQNASNNCVWIHQSVFYDQLCSHISYFICEKRLVI